MIQSQHFVRHGKKTPIGLSRCWLIPLRFLSEFQLDLFASAVERLENLPLHSVEGMGDLAKSNDTVSAKYFVIIGPLIVDNSPGADASMVEETP